MAGSIPAIITSAATANGVPPALALQVATQESSLNPNAIGGQGELGLFQLMPSTAAQLGVTDPLDPTQNANGGTSYLAQLFDEFGDWATALAAYNWGPGNVAKYGAAAAPASTQSYVANALTTAGLSPSSAAPGTTPDSSIVAAGAAPPSDDSDDVIDMVDSDGVYVPAVASAAPNILVLAMLGLGVYLAFDLLRGDA